MRKSHISMNQIPAERIFRAGYCDLCNIIPKDHAQFYNSGVYGWNCDIFIDWKTGAAISTGYRNMRGERIPHEILKKYDQRGRELQAKAWELPDYGAAARAQLERDFWDELTAYRAE